MAKKKRPYHRRQPVELEEKSLVQEAPAMQEEQDFPEEVEVIAPEVIEETPPAPPAPEEQIVLCECGDRANPGHHQCWRCSHRS
jgi:hypothetical protein